METINVSLVRSSGGGLFLLVCTYADFLNYISLCISSSISLMIYVATCFVGSKRGNNPMLQVLYVGIYIGEIVSS